VGVTLGLIVSSEAIPLEPAQRDKPAAPSRVGVVAIGRNEGERLRRCLESLRGMTEHCVYVDSGSTDGSVAMSRVLGVTVVELALDTPFTAARARNAGYRQLMAQQPDLEFVFFVDGDCEVVDGWLGCALGFLDAREDVAIAWGRRRERHPEHSIYNMLCNIEWDIPPGETPICGGDAVIRVKALKVVGGYREDLICGEEPEMCVRLRRAGWRIWHLADAMTIHDAAMHRFAQWWRRSIRNGYGVAQGVALHGAAPERHWLWEYWRNWFWGLGVPVATALLAWPFGWIAALMLLLYPAQFLRLIMRGRRSTRENWWHAAALVVGKFPETLGQFKFLKDRLFGIRPQLIEYK
jgi:GT2 family glycosyltransferase